MVYIKIGWETVSRLYDVFFIIMVCNKSQPIYVGLFAHLFSLNITYRCTCLLAREDVHTIYDTFDINCRLHYDTNFIGLYISRIHLYAAS
jgi:hypothetical protein